MSEETKFETVRRVIGEQFGVDTNKIKQDSHLTEDLGLDSLDALELMMALEEELNIELTDEQAESVDTVEGIVKILEAK